MKKLAYFKIEEDMTPRDASEKLEMAKKAGYNDVLVYHHEGADITKASYKEQLLSVFRAAYRHKVGVYLADDRYDFSGTGFGQLSSVKSLWQKVMVIKEKEDVKEGEEILLEKEGKCIAAAYPEASDKFPYGHMPDLTNPQCATLIIESVYKSFIQEYKRFVGYEFKGFLCNCPVYNMAEYGTVPYCRKAAEKARVDWDLSAIGDEYYDFAREAMEKNFVLPLKTFCDENNLEFAVATGKDSISEKFGKENSDLFLNPEGSNCYMPKITNVYEAVEHAYKYNREPVVKIGYGMEKISQVSRFFKACPDCAVVDVKAFCDTGKNGYVIVNNSEESVSLGLLPMADWVIYDWEKGEVCDFEKKTYTFYPKSFLCIRKRTADMYPEVLPVRVGGVVSGEYEVEKTLKFEREGNVVKVMLPEEDLAGKCIEFAGDTGYVKIKLGYNEYSFNYDGKVLPLYEFLCGVNCIAQEYEGKIEEIRILKKQGI